MDKNIRVIPAVLASYLHKLSSAELEELKNLDKTSAGFQILTYKIIPEIIANLQKQALERYPSNSSTGDFSDTDMLFLGSLRGQAAMLEAIKNIGQSAELILNRSVDSIDTKTK